MRAYRTTLLATVFVMAWAGPGRAGEMYNEEFRPQYHFTPAMNWMNDPNGLVYANGVFHLLFQYNPNGLNWGNISWGHATSPDLLHWTQQPTALTYQTNAGGQVTQMFFSGSAVLDANNTSGFGSPAHPPLVAMYTSFYPNNLDIGYGGFVQAGTQAQSLAYSVDGGLTWKQYFGNPVLPLPPAPYQGEFQNFRDPKIFWYAPQNKWVLVVSLAAQHKVLLYGSKNLKNWALMSSFGPANAIGGAWECPDLFPLPVDGNPAKTKWVLTVGVNPGAVAGGSGTQYFIGEFNGWSFSADDVISTDAPPGSSVIADFGPGTYAHQGWTATGGLAGTGPATGGINGQQAVTGFHGGYFVDTFENGDATTGTLTSPVFTIRQPNINFLIGGGYHPYNPATYGTANDTETAVNLLIGGKVVQSATGSNDEHVGWRSFNVWAYQGQQAQIQIVDANTGGWGHINADYFLQSWTRKSEANWLDYGPDYYAANTWNGLPDGTRIGIAWMNNWNYGGNIPTSPWRSAMSFPRQYRLATINNYIQLVQQPIVNLPSLWQAPVVNAQSSQTILPGTWTAPVNNAQGETLDISASFKTGTASQFGLLVRTGTNGDKTVIGYDAANEQIYLDRRNSGQTGFDSTFSGRYVAPFKAGADGVVRLRVLVDWSSVEVFGDAGQVVLTAQIFPQPTSTGVAVFASGGYATLQSVTAYPVNSTWSQ